MKEEVENFYVSLEPSEEDWVKDKDIE